MKWVEKYIDIPFAEYNCWQLICLVYREQFGIQIPTFKDEYKHALDRENIGKIYEREMCLWTPVDVQQLSDIIVLRVQGQPWHAGLVLSDTDMLHTERGLNSVIERYNGHIWKNRIIGFYRYNGLHKP